MTNDLLNGSKLEKLIGKLKALPMNSWERKEHSDSYEPHPDSSSVGWRQEGIYYINFLNDFKIVLDMTNYSSMSSYTSYTLKISLKKDKEKILDEITEYYSHNKSPKCNIQGLYEYLDKNFAKFIKDTKKNQERNILKKFNSVI